MGGISGLGGAHGESGRTGSRDSRAAWVNESRNKRLDASNSLVSESSAAPGPTAVRGIYGSQHGVKDYGADGDELLLYGWVL